MYIKSLTLWPRTRRKSTAKATILQSTLPKKWQRTSKTMNKLDNKWQHVPSEVTEKRSSKQEVCKRIDRFAKKRPNAFTLPMVRVEFYDSYHRKSKKKVLLLQTIVRVTISKCSKRKYLPTIRMASPTELLTGPPELLSGPTKLSSGLTKLLSRATKLLSGLTKLLSRLTELLSQPTVLFSRPAELLPGPTGLLPGLTDLRPTAEL